MDSVTQLRAELRRRLIAAREQFAGSEASGLAHDALAGHLSAVLAELQPQQLGLYWPHRREFNAALACQADMALDETAFALPYARRTPREMHYRAWDRQPPGSRDECNIPAPDGAPVVPDVVLAPCVGFTPSGLRLGYGGGYFDRWLAQYPHVVAIGVAWAFSEIADDALVPQPHDQPLMLIVTEQGVVTP